MRPFTLILTACLAASVCGCRGAGYPPNPVANPSEVTDFTTLYSENCAACHGPNGQNGPAIDLANPEYQALIDDATMRKWIANGMPGTEMPAFAQAAGGMLTDTQVDALVAGMRSSWRKTGVLGGATPPAYAETQAGDAHRGGQTYQARCSACHQPSREQINQPAYLGLVSDQALRSIMIAGRPDVGTPDWQHVGSGGPLSAQEVDDIVTYLATQRGAALTAGRR